MEEGAGEMRFRLPAAPSPGPLLFLLAACREVARAGGHTTGAVAVQLLEWELSNAVLEAFRCTASLSMVMHVQQCRLLLGVWIKAFSQQTALHTYACWTALVQQPCKAWQSCKAWQPCKA